jgi:methyl-accepting chemotaxis protein
MSTARHADDETILLPVYSRADRWMRHASLGHLSLALLLSPMHGTWAIALPLAALATGLIWVSTKLSRGTFFTRCLCGVALQLMTGLHVYQVQGMPEAHFLFFITTTLMILYADWRCLGPAAVVIVAQGLAFAFLQNSGARLYYFEQYSVSPFKIGLHVSFIIIHISICGA